MYLKMASCYDNKNASMNEIQNCLQNTQVPMQNIQQTIEHEMNQFQNRLQRGSQACQDEVRDSFGNDTSKQAQAEKLYLQCMNKTVEKHIAMLPNIQTNLEREIDKFSK